MAPAKKKARPKTGEPRDTNRVLLIDLLPEEVHEAIKTLRYAQGLTWKQIEQRSEKNFSPGWEKDRGGFVDWNGLEARVKERFEDFKLPSTSLHRWNDLRIAQARKEVLEDGDAAAEFAEKLSKLEVDGMKDAVINAYTREVFGMIRDTGVGDRMGLLKALNSTSLVLTRLQRLKLSQDKVAAETAKANADKARFEAQAGNPREIYMQAATDLLKKLNTRKDVRAVLDPIRAELVEEISHGAESFAKEVEAAAA